MSSFIIAQQIRAIGKMYMLYAGIFNSIVGIIGNILIILVFTTQRSFTGNQSAFYLTVESISNIGLLFTIDLTRILTYILGYDLALTSLRWCKIRAMMSQIFGLCSLFSVCFLSFDQYLSTNLQYSWRQMSSLKLAYRLTFINICFSILHSSTFYIFTENQSSMGCAVYKPELKRYYSFFYYLILSTILPIIISITSSLLAYRNVRRIIRLQVPIIRRRVDRQMTAMTLARVMVFLVCGIPFICISLYEFNVNYSKDNYMELAIVNLVSSIFHSLLYTNFMINFYIFLMISSRFRHQTKNFLLKRCWRFIKCQYDKRPPSTYRNQISPVIPPFTISADEQNYVYVMPH